MNTLEQYFQYSLLSQAGYVDDLISGMSKDNLRPLYEETLKSSASNPNQFTDQQAIDFTEQYRVLATQPNTATGFAATVFQDVDTGEIIFSIRGTEGGFSLVSSFLTNQQVYGETQTITTEGNSHLIEPFMDSLALQSMMSTLDNSLTLVNANRLYQTAASDIASSDKNLIASFYKLFVGNTITGTDGISSIESYLPDIDIEAGFDFGIGKGETADRDKYYQALFAIESNTLYQTLSGSVDILDLSANMSTSTLISNAEVDIAYRYALKNLTPFVLLGNGVNALYETRNTNGELDPYDPTTDTGTLTETYLRDRAYFLTQLLDVNQTDAAIYTSTQPEYLRDIGSNTILATNASVNTSLPFLTYQQTIFGDDTNNTFTGGNQNDRLYGGGGDDVINGLNGSDTIEGNQGDDILTGGSDNATDQLFGGAGTQLIYATNSDTTRSDDILFGRQLAA